MFFGFSKRNAAFPVSTLAPDGLFDLHTHVLPMVDDGAKGWDESRAMLDGFADLGYIQIAATPHFDSRGLTPSIAAQRQLIAKLDEHRENRVPEICPSAEITFDELFVTQEGSGGFPHLGAERTYLVEFGSYLGSVPTGVEKIAFQLIVKGVTLILAHPERYPDLVSRPGQVESLRRSGVLFQLDILALVGRYGPKVKREALSMLERREVDFVSSDLHTPDDLPYLREALEALARFDKGEFKRLASENPRHILQGRPAEVRRGG